MPTLDLDIRLWLARYLAGEITLREFRTWFVPSTWNVHRTGNPAAEKLTGEISLRIAELTSGHRTEGEIRTMLLPLVQRYTVDSGLVQLTTSADNLRSVFNLPVRAAGRRPVAAFS